MMALFQSTRTFGKHHIKHLFVLIVIVLFIFRSVSFVLVTSSLAFLFLILCYIVIDVKCWWSGKPFLFAGMNSIIMYVGHSLTYSSFPFRWILAGRKELNTHFLMTMENLWGTAGWILVAYFLYRNKFFLKI